MDRPDDMPLFRKTDPPSSRVAAQAVKDSGAFSRQKDAVRAALLAHPGSTSAELAHAMGVDRYMTARRLPDLEEIGLAFRGPARMCLVNKGLAITWYPYATEGVKDEPVES